MEDGKIIMPEGFKRASIKISKETQSKIDKYLSDNNLNEYGDKKDTMYMGGTPLYNESNGSSTNRYEYVLKKFPQLAK
ncbi:MAG: hypothetical protein COB02_16030 [Candidatus Cloacimonadota bacterium]|nr:MAG: hypothetical protein COB02_16030 [Candidatus Cloacimonadota bacterium]